MAGLKNKDVQRVNYGLLKDCDFTIPPFVDEQEMYFNGEGVLYAFEKAKSTLNKLSKKYIEISEAYEKIRKTCGAEVGGKAADANGGGTVMRDDETITEQLKKHIKKTKKRAEYSKQRIKTIENAVNQVRLAAIQIGTKYDSAMSAANDAMNASEQDN